MSVLLFLPFFPPLSSSAYYPCHHSLSHRSALSTGWRWGNVQSVCGQSAGLGLKGLPVLREVSPSLWVTVEEKEWKWTCLFKSRSAFILWASQDPLASTITCFKESRGLGELPITLPSLGQLTTNIFGLCQGFLIYLIYQEWIHTPLLCSILVPLIPVSLPLPQLHH